MESTVPTHIIPANFNNDAPASLNETAWPMAGLKLTPELHDAWKIPAPQDKSKPLLLQFGINPERYNVAGSYLVPYYPLASVGDDLSRSAEEFALDRVTRFFYTAEPQLDVTWTREAIARATQEFRTTNDPDVKSTRARYLIGAMVNRLGRLTRVYFQGDLQGVKIDLSDEQTQALQNASRPLADLRLLRRVMKNHMPSKDVTARESELREEIRNALSPIQKEFNEYYKFLAFGVGVNDQDEAVDISQSIVDNVHLRDMSLDRDGILKHLIREIGKMWGYENEGMQVIARAGVVTHIGQTMEAIDETKTTILRLLKNPKVLQGLIKAANEYRDSLPEESIAIRTLLDKGALNLVEEYAAICRARAGIKSDDAESFALMRERATLIETTIYEVHKRLKNIGREAKETETSEVRDILQKGFDMMGSMAQLRIPRNRHAPAFADKIEIARDEAIDQSSVRRFQRSAEAWLQRNKSGRAGSIGM
jgi:hypothetical protein